MTMYPHLHAASNASHWVTFRNFADKRSQDAASAPEITNTLSVPSETNRSVQPVADRTLRWREAVQSTPWRRQRPPSTFVKAGVACSVTNTTDVPESISISIDGLESKMTVVNVYHQDSLPLQPGFYSRFFGARSGIVLGDFNAHSALFGSPSTDVRGRQLEDNMEANAYVALNTGAPTFLSNATGSTSHLDLARAS